MKTKKLLTGVLLANLFALVMMIITRWLYDMNIMFSGLFVASDFIIIPMIMGIINAHCSQNYKLKTGEQLLYATLNLVVLLLQCIYFMKEGVFCLIIVLPLLVAFFWLGLWIGEIIIRRKKRNLKVSVLGLLFILFVADVNADHLYIKLVSDEIIINATPERIWKHVVVFEPIKEESDFWMFRLGMPQPMQTTVSGYFQGADRKCIFNDSIIFDEKMIVFKPNENLTFDIVKQPADPEIIGHIETQRGQFLLKDNHNGTTTLIGNSWYKLNVFPTWYYDLWAESIVRNVHLRVMKHIKKLSEIPS